ncbi:ubiquitin-conjugating enzyme E2 Z isoform X8 [Stigmatopora argus]
MRSTCSTLAINVMSTPALSSAVTGQSGGSSSLQTLANSLMGGPLPTSSALADEGDQSDQSPEGSATEGLAAPQTGFWDAFVLSPPVVSVSPNVHTASPTQDVGQGVAGMAGPGPLTQVYSASWDPTRSMDWDNEKTSQPAILRIKRDIMSIYKEPPPGMFIVPDPQDMTKIHALITGPFDTPYEGGFFLFLFRCPPDYPIHPPRVKLITTGQNTVRFNPNFYRNGKVCLSILGFHWLFRRLWTRSRYGCLSLSFREGHATRKTKAMLFSQAASRILGHPDDRIGNHMNMDRTSVESCSKHLLCSHINSIFDDRETLSQRTRI